MEKQKYLLGSRVGTLESRDVQCGSIHIVYMLKRRIVIAMLDISRDIRSNHSVLIDYFLVCPKAQYIPFGPQ